MAKELNALITRYIEGGCDSQDIADELVREANYVFGHVRLYYQRLQSGSLAEVLAHTGYGQHFSEVR